MTSLYELFDYCEGSAAAALRAFSVSSIGATELFDFCVVMCNNYLINGVNIMNLDRYIKHLRDREYMSGVERERSRVKATGEVFTPTPLVQEVLDQLDPELFRVPGRTFLDPSCGDGQFLSEVLIRKLESGQEFEVALGSIYGVDLMEDNVRLCRERLLCGREEFRHIVERNIVCHDALTYDYSFGHPVEFGNGLFSVE